MELTIEAIISFVSLFFGGTGLFGFLWWRESKRKVQAEAAQAEAEVKLKEAEARKAQFEADKERQDYYQQLARDLAEDREDRKRQNDELRAERDHYKQERNEQRDQNRQRDDEFRQFRRQCEEELDQLKRTQARQGRQIEAMRPFMCGDLRCVSRQPVTTLDPEELERTIHTQMKPTVGSNIEPHNTELQ